MSSVSAGANESAKVLHELSRALPMNVLLPRLQKPMCSVKKSTASSGGFFLKVVVIRNESVKIQRRPARISFFASWGMLLFEQDGKIFSEQLFRK
jgi:hypothetical protein